MDQAIHSDSFVGVEPPKQQEAPVIEARDKNFQSLARSRGWKEFMLMAEEYTADLRALKGSDLQGKSLEEVGQRFLIASLTADSLDALFAVVEASAQAAANDS